MIGHLHRQGLSTGACGASLSGNTQGLPIRVLWVTERRRPLGLFICCRFIRYGRQCLPLSFSFTKRSAVPLSRSSSLRPHTRRRLVRVVRVCTYVHARWGDGTNRAASLKSAPSGYKTFRVAANMRHMYSISKNFIRCVAS